MEKYKVRPVWVQPFETLLIEGIFARPLYELYKRIGFPMHFGESAMYRLNRILNRDIESE